MDGGQWVHDYEIDITGTPCEQVITQSRLVHIPDHVFSLYPGDPDFRGTGIVSYMGVPLTDVDGKILGHMAVIDRRPIPDDPRVLALFRIFAARAAAEMRRLRAEREAREREEKLTRLVNSAMDAIIELDHSLRVTRINPAAEKAFQCEARQVVGHDFSRFLAEEGRTKLLTLIDQLETLPEGQRYLWIPGGLKPCARTETSSRRKPLCPGSRWHGRPSTR